VWEELHASIRGFVARRVRQQADVDDVVQRVFLQVHRALPTLRRADKLHAVGLPDNATGHRGFLPDAIAESESGNRHGR
jgi:hypothetical protein